SGGLIDGRTANQTSQGMAAGQAEEAQGHDRGLRPAGPGAAARPAADAARGGRAGGELLQGTTGESRLSTSDQGEHEVAVLLRRTRSRLPGDAGRIRDPRRRHEGSPAPHPEGLGGGPARRHLRGGRFMVTPRLLRVPIESYRVPGINETLVRVMLKVL